MRQALRQMRRTFQTGIWPIWPVFSQTAYIHQWKEFDKLDYSTGTTVLLDRIEDQLFQ
jgi:hypothetical protein